MGEVAFISVVPGGSGPQTVWAAAGSETPVVLDQSHRDLG